MVRPDALVRFWCIGGFQPGPAYDAAAGVSSFRECTLSSHVFLSDGSTHVRADELDDLYNCFVAASAADPEVPQRLGKHFVALGEEWVAECERIGDRESLRGVDNEGLAVLLNRFCAQYSAYAPALYLPFAIERLYAERFPPLVEELSSRLHTALRSELGEAAPTAVYLDANLIAVAAPAAIAQAIQPALEESPLRTAAEQRDAAIAAIATAVAAAGERAIKADPTELEREFPALAEALDQLSAEHGWIDQWGYPPRYRASSVEELWDNVLRRAERLLAMPQNANVEAAGLARERLLELAGADAAERQLVADFAYYSYYRTRRMELLIRSQYLSTPLFEEIGERLGLESYAWTRLTPPELSAALLDPALSAPLGKHAELRADGWMLRCDGLSGERQLLDGEEFRSGATAFTSVLRAGENARGEVDATDPAAVGGKAASLARMAEGSFLVPDFAVLTTAGVTALGTDAGPAVETALAEAVASLAGSGPLAVRSSASVEDGAAHSWAGRFETVLGVDAAAVPAAVAAVIESTQTTRVRDYARRIGSEGPIQMAVIVQRQIAAEFAGVINTSIRTEDGSAIEIELVRGLGDKLVDGSVTPTRFLIGADDEAVRSGPELAVPEPVLTQLVDLARYAEAFFGRPQDIEFGISEGTVFTLQSRPLTGQAGSIAPDAAADAVDLTEVVAGLSGHVSTRVVGTVVKPEQPGELERLAPGSILVLRAATPVWDGLVFQAAALVTDEGGSTSHAIRVANEFEIPAVVGTRLATASLATGERVIVDTIQGTSRGRVLREAA